MTKLLVVDTDEILRRMLTVFLSDSGYHVHEASNGNEALNVLRRHPVDIIISEMVLPEKDGFEMLMELRNRPSAPKFIAITGGGRFPLEYYLRMAENLGAHYVVAKPFQLEQLLTAVDQLRTAPRKIVN